jgi:hypothetical protein
MSKNNSRRGRSVLVVLHVKALKSLTGGGTTLVGTKGSLRVGLAPGEEDSPGVLNVLLLASPGLEGARLKGTAERDGESPWLLGVELVHGIQVESGLFLTLPTREEDDGGHSSRDSPLEGTDGVLGNDLRGHLLGVGARGDHVGLQKGTLKEDVVLVESLVAGSKHQLSDISTALNVMRSINKDLRLNNGHQTVLLADDGVASQTLGIQVNGQLGWLIRANLENSTPLGKAGTSLVVLGAALSKVIMALGGGLLVGANNLNGTLVDLDAGEDTTLLEDINKGLAILGLLVEGLLKEDHTAEVLEGTRGAEEELTEGTAVLFNVLDIDAGKALADGAGGLISSKDTLARGANVGSVLGQLLCKISAQNISKNEFHISLSIHMAHQSTY